MKPIGCLALLAFLALPALAGAPDAVTPDGGRYFGPLADGKLHGRGRIEWANGIRYEGDFAHGLLHGRGRLQVPDREVYEGEFQQGMYHGKGRFEEDGEVYEGDFVKDDFTGQGRHKSRHGTTYEGSFRKWKYHGPGRFTDPAGKVYEGNFADGMLVGRGTVTGKDAAYEGELKNWQFHGRGVLRHANGDVYEGSFEYGFYQGQGTLKYGKPRPDGRTQESGVWQYGALRNQEDRAKLLADAEKALYSQKTLLDNALASLKAGEPGKVDMYLLAVAGYGPQEVFRREVDFVQDAFARRFGTVGRSVALINSRNTFTSAPMATLTSIRTAVGAIGAKMNRDEDILFLFLTSHGSKDHELTLDQVGMDLRGLRAKELGSLLKESGIKWKVVLVSACYSGGFIDPLKDDGTLVMTAARRDRRSFGCADENDFTHFGRAFFKEALPGAQSFQHAFKKASALVGEWERKEAGEDSRSLPQIHAPAPIEAHLKRWWGGLTPR